MRTELKITAAGGDTACSRERRTLNAECSACYNLRNWSLVLLAPLIHPHSPPLCVVEDVFRHILSSTPSTRAACTYAPHASSRSLMIPRSHPPAWYVALSVVSLILGDSVTPDDGYPSNERNRPRPKGSLLGTAYQHNYVWAVGLGVSQRHGLREDISHVFLSLVMNQPSAHTAATV